MNSQSFTNPTYAALRRRLAVGLCLVAVCALQDVQAHGPTRQKVIESVDIDAPAEKVWALVGDFAEGWPKWHPAIEASSADNGNTVGSQRRLTIKGGKFLVERLDLYEPATMTLKYVIRSGDALPVTNYSSMVTVRAEGSKTHVEWRGAFYRGYPNNDPPPELNDDAALTAVTGVYKTGLENLKVVAEKH